MHQTLTRDTMPCAVAHWSRSRSLLTQHQTLTRDTMPYTFLSFRYPDTFGITRSLARNIARLVTLAASKNLLPLLVDGFPGSIVEARGDACPSSPALLASRHYPIHPFLQKDAFESIRESNGTSSSLRSLVGSFARVLSASAASILGLCERLPYQEFPTAML